MIVYKNRRDQYALSLSKGFIFKGIGTRIGH